jgi:hypothetical protein
MAQRYGPDFDNLTAADQDGVFRFAQMREIMNARRDAASAAAGARADARAERAKKSAELSAVENKQLGLYKLGAEAESQFNKATADKDNYDPTEVGQIFDNSEWAPNFLKNDKAIEAQAAQSNWVEAFLRDASGAAIPPNERGAYAKDFFPMPGDPEDVVKNKASMRKQKMQNALIGAGPGAGNMVAAQPSNDVQEKARQELARRKQKQSVAGNQ